MQNLGYRPTMALISTAAAAAASGCRWWSPHKQLKKPTKKYTNSPNFSSSSRFLLLFQLIWMLRCYSLLQWLIESHTNVSRLTVCAYVRVCVCLCICKIQLLFAIENRMCVCLCMFVFWSANWNWTSVWCSLFILSPHSALFNCTTIWWTIRLAKITNKQTFTPHYFFRLANTSSSVENTHTLRSAPLILCHYFARSYVIVVCDSDPTSIVIFLVRIIALLLIPITHSTFSTSTSSFCFCFPIFLSFISICILLLLSLLFLLSLIAFDFDLCCFEYWLSLFSHQNENKGYAQRKKCVEIINDMYIHP